MFSGPFLFGLVAVYLGMYAIAELIYLKNKGPGEKSAGQRISRQGINFGSSYIPGLGAPHS